MNVTDSNNLEYDHIQGREETPAVKWRRSGKDRRGKKFETFTKGRRDLRERRTNWLDAVSAIIFPRGSKKDN